MDSYNPPPVTVDGIVFQLLDGKLQLLLIRRAREPFKDEWALPGGYVSSHETTTAALERVLAAKAGMRRKDAGLIDQLYTFDMPAVQDPRGHAVSIAYMVLCRDFTPAEHATTETPTFFPVDALPALAYDHADIVRYAHERLRSKILYTNTVHTLIPPHFTLTQLQQAYEAIIGRALDKRNFRKKFLSLGLAEATDEYTAEGAHRPARLYRFTRDELQVLSRSFD